MTVIENIATVETAAQSVTATICENAALFGAAPERDEFDICLTNNAAECALRGIALGRKSWLFCGSDRGGVRAAAMYTLIGTAKLNNVDPQAWLADALGRIAGTPQTRLDELLPWNWKDNRRHDQAA